MSWDSDEAVFKVVRNAEEQYSIWPDYRDPPAGWFEVGMRGNRRECIAYINQTWTDMRPLSLRRELEEPAP